MQTINQKTNTPKILITGGSGLLGSALQDELSLRHHWQVLAPSRRELDLRDFSAVKEWLQHEQPDVVIHAAAKVGGIKANSTYPADFIVENLRINLNVIEAARVAAIPKLVNLGSNCFYPSGNESSILETAVLTGGLEPTNEAYALAKLAGFGLCRSIRKQDGLQFFTVVPCSLYGPRDNFHPENGHFVASLIARMYHAKQEQRKQIIVWGTGKPRRELLHARDAARGIVDLIEFPQSELIGDLINLGTSEDHSIGEVAELIRTAVDYSGELVFDTSRPDGMMRKLLNSSRSKELIGFKPQISLADGLRETAEFYGQHYGA